MNKLYTSIVTVFIVIISFTSAISQDRIVLKNGDKIDCTIRELSDTEVKYTEIKDANQIIFSISRGQVREIKFAYGKTIEEKPDAINESYYFDDKKSNLKINFTALAGNATILTYERAINSFSSFEVTPKIIGLGFNNDDFEDRSGFGLDLGYKMKLGSIFKKSSYRPDHILHGSYLRINGGYAYSTKESTTNFIYKETKNFAHFGLDLGKQWILQNTLSLDLFGGFHYFGGSFKAEDEFGDRGFNNDEFQHGDLWGDETVAVSFGLRVGFLFEKYGKSTNKKNRR